MENLKTFFFTAISQTPVTCNTTYANESRMSRSTKPIWPYDGKLANAASPTNSCRSCLLPRVPHLLQKEMDSFPLPRKFHCLIKEVRGGVVFPKQVHFLSRKMVYLALVLLRYLSFSKEDSLMDLLSKLVYGDLTQVRDSQAKRGPFLFEDQVRQVSGN
ncbi:hypothetical protein RchiOBHm_Chr2g0105511 [Rosa chinensis]|uniref:Uncharacterized protein n=1 Tax=Rosa chinensis TaxID=74649 RepID=A0A2P6RNG6_ROSCH|nr:hypothetical protein RchiOBHm_Chr2g0105511 [Rosa chinensis]